MPHLFFIILKFKKMKFPLFVFLAVIDFGFIVVKGDESDLCKIWSDIERQLQNEDFLISCTTNYNCYGVNCSGATRGYNITSTIHLHACENPPYVEFEVDVPKLDINGIKRRITHNDSIPLTKNLNIEFGIERRNQMLRLGVFVHFINNGSFPLLRVPMRIPVISNLNFPINCSFPEETTGISSSVNHVISTVSSPPKSFLIVSKSNADGYSNCSIVNSTCNEEEMCQQIDKMKPDGICICITNYTRNEHGKCVLHNQAVDNYSSVVLAAILVPIFVGLVLVAVVYIMIRFRIFQNLRRRLRVQVYEHVLLGEDEEEEEDMTNPVA